jgi:phospholipid/cholesterol/gamma-HCH transport system permease protein
MAHEPIQPPELLTIDTADRFYHSVRRIVSETQRDGELTIDFSGVERLDSAGVVTLEKLRAEARERQIDIRYSNTTPALEKTINLFARPLDEKAPPRQRRRLFELIGEYSYRYWVIMRDFTMLLSNILFFGVYTLLKSNLRRKGEVIRQSNFIGVSAFPIITLVAFLIGFVLTLQAAVQMRPFGAEIFVAQLITYAMIGEMGPLITAIMIAGRSGSSIAAEIGAMKVSEEIDALRSMGIDPVPYLIVPKLFAIMITLPMLTALANFAGIFGGAVIGFSYLQIELNAFYNEVVYALRYKEIITSFVKSIIFAVIILVTAAYYGLHAEGGAEGVGRSTTRSVVVSIFLVIIADSILGLIFYLE